MTVLKASARWAAPLRNSIVTIREGIKTANKLKTRSPELLQMCRVPSATHAMMGAQGLCLYLTIRVRLHISWCLPSPDTFLLTGMRCFFFFFFPPGAAGPERSLPSWVCSVPLSVTITQSSFQPEALRGTFPGKLPVYRVPCPVCTIPTYA